MNTTSDLVPFCFNNAFSLLGRLFSRFWSMAIGFCPLSYSSISEVLGRRSGWLRSELCAVWDLTMSPRTLALCTGTSSSLNMSQCRDNCNVTACKDVLDDCVPWSLCQWCRESFRMVMMVSCHQAFGPMVHLWLNDRRLWALSASNKSLLCNWQAIPRLMDISSFCEWIVCSF